MPLTPADVHNVAFKKPFLDEVERELVRLVEDNNELRAQLERGGGHVSGASPVVAGAPEHLVQENNELRAELDRMQHQLGQAEQAVHQAQQEAAQFRDQGMPAGVPAGADGGEQQALRVLMMAQRTADDHVSDARREADKLLSDARAKADESLERDARQRHQEAMGGLEVKRAALQKHIEELKAFEREYRTRLKAYLESQLRDLGARGQGIEDELNRTAVGSGSGSSNGAAGLSAAGLTGSYAGGRGALGGIPQSDAATRQG
jgi:cell division septum initiation protein DivIVA